MQTPVAMPVATPMPVAIAVPSGAPAAEGALAKLGNPTGSLAFELVALPVTFSLNGSSSPNSIRVRQWW